MPAGAPVHWYVVDPATAFRRSVAPGSEPASTRYDVAPLPPTQDNDTVDPITLGAINIGAPGNEQGGGGVGDVLPTVTTTSFDGALDPYALLASTRT